MSVANGFGMGRRLLLAQAMVLVAGGVTTWVVALVVGPPLFREHLHQAGVTHNSNEQFHAEQAYQNATALSIAVAITVSALTAFIVTAILSRRLQQSISEVSAAASAIAEGRYNIRVGSPRLAMSSMSWQSPSTRWPNGSKPWNQPVGNCSQTWPMRSAHPWRCWKPTWKPWRTE